MIFIGVLAGFQHKYSRIQGSRRQKINLPKNKKLKPKKEFLEHKMPRIKSIE